MDDIRTKKLSVIGLGKLGACSAACFASKDFQVLGVDIRQEYVNAVNNGIAPVEEAGLQELIKKSSHNLSATTSYEKAIANSNVTFLIVPTPSQEDGNFSDKFLRDAITGLCASLHNSTKPYHLFVITSTVSPGTTEQSLIPLLESSSGRKLNEGFGVCYNPEFIALGTVINDFLNPDLVLIGQSDKRAGDELEAIYRKVCDNQPRIARMSIVSSEITKISLNSYVTMKISFANTLASICEAVPGANIDDITSALGADRRISPYYLKGGLSFGGPCFPRDNRAFAAFAERHGKEALLAKATDEVNVKRIMQVVEQILRSVSKTKSVSILGLSYKPSTPVVEESPAMRIIEELLKKSINVVVYDSLAVKETQKYFGNRIFYAASVQECLDKSAIAVITTQANEFKQLHAGMIVHDPTTIIDCWRILDRGRLGEKVRLIPLGVPKDRTVENN